MKSRDAEIYYEPLHTFYFESDTECEWVFLRLTTQSFKTDLAVFRDTSYNVNKGNYIKAVLLINLLNELPCSAKFRHINIVD